MLLEVVHKSTFEHILTPGTGAYKFHVGECDLFRSSAQRVLGLWHGGNIPAERPTVHLLHPLSMLGDGGSGLKQTMEELPVKPGSSSEKTFCSLGEHMHSGSQ